jgi:hypothetical protein
MCEKNKDSVADKDEAEQCGAWFFLFFGSGSILFKKAIFK